jgi:hypothetical protein
MGRYSTRSIVALALVLFAEIALADQGAPVYTATGTKPTVGGACTGLRVQIDDGTGQIWNCVGGLWAKGGTVEWNAVQNKPGTFTPATHTHLGAEVTSAVATSTALAANPADCAAGQYATTIDAEGDLACAQVSYAQISGTPLNLAAEPFITKTASANLSNEFALATLATGLLKNTTTTGVPTIAVAGTDYAKGFTGTNAMLKGDGSNGGIIGAVSGTDYAPATTGSSLLKGNGAGGFTAATAQACTDQAMTGLSAAGVATCTTLEPGLHVALGKPSDLDYGVNMPVNDEFRVPAKAIGGDQWYGVKPVLLPSENSVLPLCQTSMSGQFALLRPTATSPSEVHICLKNSDDTWGWAMFAIAPK